MYKQLEKVMFAEATQKRHERQIVSCNMKQWTAVFTRIMADFSAISSHIGTHKLSYFTFYPKSQKTLRAMVRHLPEIAPVEDSSDE